MNVAVASPVRPGATSGNDVTAARWVRRLTELGHEVTDVPFDTAVDDAATVVAGRANEADVVVALHARRCAPIVEAALELRPDRPVVVGLAGTDLYRDLPDDADALGTITTADRLVVLQAAAVGRLAEWSPALAAKTHVVHQSVDPPLPSRPLNRPTAFTVVVLAHLREVKDPLLAARATRLLPESSTVRIDHAGMVHDELWAARARREADENPRYHWHRELRRPDALGLLARADVLACTSRLEGGANVVTEAIALGVPVVGTRIDGNTGLVGDDYPALVPVGDAQALAELFLELESDAAVYADLEARVADRRHLTEPANERAEWAAVLDAVTTASRSG